MSPDSLDPKLRGPVVSDPDPDDPQPRNEDSGADNRGVRDERERLAELERRSLLSEQARQLAHGMRTPLSVIELVCEAMQMEAPEDSTRMERLDSVLGAAARLSTIITDTVSSARFADGPQRLTRVDEIAARVVRLNGGRVNNDARTDGDGAEVMLCPEALEAGVMHALRLIGCSASNIGGRPRPLLQCETRDTLIRLRFSADGDTPSRSPLPSADQHLMLQAAERVVRDGGGSLLVDERSVVFELPVVGTPLP
jgi:signal transduction histidine kinase